MGSKTCKNWFGCVSCVCSVVFDVSVLSVCRQPLRLPLPFIRCLIFGVRLIFFAFLFFFFFKCFIYIYIYFVICYYCFICFSLVQVAFLFGRQILWIDCNFGIMTMEFGPRICPCFSELEETSMAFMLDNLIKRLLNDLKLKKIKWLMDLKEGYGKC